MREISFEQMHCVAGGLMSADSNDEQQWVDAAYCGVSVGGAVTQKTPTSVLIAVNDCIPIATVVVTATAAEVQAAKAELESQWDKFVNEASDWFNEQMYGDSWFGGSGYGGSGYGGDTMYESAEDQYAYYC